MSLPTTTIARPPPPFFPPLTLSTFAKLRWAVNNPPLDPHISFAGKTVLVTGANTGLGHAAALKYAQKGCSKLILTVRSHEKGLEAKTSILEKSGRQNELDFISVLTVDLLDFKSVKTFAADLEKQVKPTGLYIALLNAGLANPEFSVAESGYEEALQVNVLSTALMAHLILPLLERSNTGDEEVPHLTFVNSIAHAEVERAWYANTGKRGLLAYANNSETFEQRRHYAAVKLLGMSVMQHFAQSVGKSADGRVKVIVNACCPFVCRTDLGRKFSAPMKIIMGAVQWFTARSAEEGARTLVGATVLGEESQGGFWHHDVLYPMGELAKDEVEMKKCWEDIWGASVREVQVKGVKAQ